MYLDRQKIYQPLTIFVKIPMLDLLQDFNYDSKKPF